MKKTDVLSNGIDRALEEGKDAKEIAKAFNCSVSFVYMILRRKKKKVSRARTCAVTCEQVEALWKEGYSLEESAALLNCCRSTVVNRRNELTFGMSPEEKHSKGLVPVNQKRGWKRK